MDIKVRQDGKRTRFRHGEANLGYEGAKKGHESVLLKAGLAAIALDTYKSSVSSREYGKPSFRMLLISHSMGPVLPVLA
jgi:hypothetical protein